MPRIKWHRVRVTGDHAAMTPQRFHSATAQLSGGSDEPGVSLRGEGKVPTVEKLSAPITAMNNNYGADLGETDNVWVNQQRDVVNEDEEMRDVALNNDRSQFEMVLEQEIKDLLIDRHDKDGVLLHLYFANPDFHVSLVCYPADTYDEFRHEHAL